MSALGQKPTCAVQEGMSALPPESGHWRCTNQCPLSANSGHTRTEIIETEARVEWLPSAG
jgi:hypothetical protein